ncbi:MAG: TetR/AcrR family transcriptional regulator [Opitutaceae bacterium]|nr:TetR/AcrR family transcriptional regulator [Opitutaceae bacterium]
MAKPLHSPAASITDRILRTAHEHLFAYGYHSLTMDNLAHELGISKKTLYVHFRAKDVLLGRVIDALSRTIRDRMDLLVSNPQLTFAQKLQEVAGVVESIMGRASPATFRDLQRSAPHLYGKIEEIRQRIIPDVFGRIIRAGIAEGAVRADIDAEFAALYWLQAIRGLVQPDNLERTRLTIPQTLEKALPLFVGGLLTLAGRKDYEKHLSSYANKTSL